MSGGSERGPEGRKSHNGGGEMMKVGGSRRSNDNVHMFCERTTTHRFSGVKE